MDQYIDEDQNSDVSSDKDTNKDSTNFYADEQCVGMDNYFNCLCVKFDTLMKRKSDNQVFIVEHALCMLSKNNFFTPLFDTLDKILHLMNRYKKLLWIA